MGQLLDMVFSNPILMFLIIGAIMSFLQRGKEQEAQKETRKNASPIGKGKKRDVVDWREIFRQEATPPTPKKRVEQTYTYTEQQEHSPSPNNELLEKYERAKRNREATKKYDEKLKNSPIFKDDLTQSEKVQLDFSNISREEAIKGVVWSEILGKPRAKGSHRPSMNLRRKV